MSFLVRRGADFTVVVEKTSPERPYPEAILSLSTSEARGLADSAEGLRKIADEVEKAWLLK